MTARTPSARTPLAIALSYERERDPAPRVVASGRGAVAEQILALAFAKGVKVREDADLAEVLSIVDVDSVIPLEAFAAVAEIIAYLYRANASMAAGNSIEEGAAAAADTRHWTIGTPNEDDGQALLSSSESPPSSVQRWHDQARADRQALGHTNKIGGPEKGRL